ncbi:MAG: hypothetical protein R2697_12575 [Ilumatobacteraceae bacterium]
MDGKFVGMGVRGAGSVTELQVSGRGGVPSGSGAVVLNVTVTEPRAAGFVAVFPCGSAVPGTSNVNFVAGQTVANAAVVKTDGSGRVCVFTSAAAHVVIDVSGMHPEESGFVAVSPARLMDSRVGGSSVDGKFVGMGVRGAGSVTELQVSGRGGVPSGSGAVVLNVTVTEPRAAGFVAVFPCGSAVPGTSNVNFVAGQTVANAAVVKTDGSGRVCVFTSAAAHVVIDVSGVFPTE